MKLCHTLRSPPLNKCGRTGATSSAHPRESGGPGLHDLLFSLLWIPACAGMSGWGDVVPHTALILPHRCDQGRACGAPPAGGAGLNGTTDTPKFLPYCCFTPGMLTTPVL